MHGVPTFTVLQDICARYLVDHRFVPDVDGRPFCTCRLELDTHDDWVEHVTELQASHLAMAIQEARSHGRFA